MLKLGGSTAVLLEATPPPPGGSFIQAPRHGPAPVEMTTDKAAAYLRVLNELVPAALHVTEQYANNAVEATMAGLKPDYVPCAD